MTQIRQDLNSFAAQVGSLVSGNDSNGDVLRKNDKNMLIASVAAQVLGAIVVVSGVVFGISALCTIGAPGAAALGVVFLISAIAKVVLGHDLMVIGNNAGRQAIKYNYIPPSLYQGTWVIGSFVKHAELG